MNILKILKNNELNILVDEKLIYTRFLNKGEEKIYDKSGYDKYLAGWSKGKCLNQEMFLIAKAKLKMISTKDGGRKTALHSGYRPNHIFEYKTNGIQTTWIGDVIFDGLIEPGEEKIVTVRFWLEQPIERYLSIGRQWWIHEGATKVSDAEILSVSLQ